MALEWSQDENGVWRPNTRDVSKTESLNDDGDAVAESDELPEVLANNNETGANNIVLDAGSDFPQPVFPSQGAIILKDPNLPNGTQRTDTIFQVENPIYQGTKITVAHGDPLGSEGQITIQATSNAALKHAASGNGFSAGLVYASVAGDLFLNDEMFMVGTGSGGDRLKLTVAPTDPNRVQTFQDKSGVIALQDANGTIEVEGGLIFGDAATYNLVGNTDDAVIPNIGSSVLIRLTTAGPLPDLTGIIPDDITKSAMIMLLNVGATSIILRNNDAGSAAQNRFLMGGNITLQPDEGAIFVYDTVDLRWRCSAKNI